jgi:hypothetical protein
MKSPKPKPHNLLYLHRDRGYRFKDRDPVLEEICDIISKSGLSGFEISQLTASKAGGFKVAPSTITKWLDGTTKKPQNFTVTWVGYVLGWRRGWTKI